MKMIVVPCMFLAALAVPSVQQDSDFKPISPCPDVFRGRPWPVDRNVDITLRLLTSRKTTNPKGLDGKPQCGTVVVKTKEQEGKSPLEAQWPWQIALYHYESQSQCGKVVLNPTPLVVNGAPTLEGQWPWHIALYQTHTVDNKYICGGTLVSHKHVITAAHCVTRKSSQRLVDQNTLTVYLGKHNLRTSVDGVQIRFVKEIIVNPNYNASTFSRDVAILELREPVTYSDWVRPACLWPYNEVDLKNVIGKKGSVVGWGFDITGVATEELSMVDMPVVSQETCIRSYSEFFVRFTSEYTYCAGNRDGTSVCNGDSGGGMVFRMNGVWYLRGLASLLVERQNEYRCDPTHFVIFTDLAKFLPWIYATVSDF